MTTISFMLGAQASCLRFAGIFAGLTASGPTPSLPFLSSLNLFMRLVNQLGNLFGARAGAAIVTLALACMVFVHLALVLVKIKFVDSGRANFESLDISCLASHRFTLSSVDSENSRFV